MRDASAFRIWIARLMGCLCVATVWCVAIRATPANLYAPSVYHPRTQISKPFTLSPPSTPTRSSKKARPVSDVMCMAQTLFFEAANEPLEGIEAVAAVVFNRVDSKRYPRTVCGVVYQPLQFSWTRDAGKSVAIPPKKYITLAETFFRERAILQEKYTRLTHFHHIGVQPAWSNQLQHVNTYGQHKFYQF